MATFTDTIQILIKADGAKAVGELKKVGDVSQRELDKSEKSARNWSATFTRAGVGLTTFAAVAGAGLYKAAQAADEAQQAQLRLDNTIANSPRLTEQSARAFRDLAAALMAKTVVDDDAIVSAEALLGQFKLTEGQILSLTPLVVDLSRKMGIDLDSAAKAVGKAVNGSSGALKRYGVDIKAGADGTIQFDDVVNGLAASVGGFAEGEAKTFTGQIEQMKNQLGEVAENVGSGVIPMFEAMLGPIRSVSDAFGSLPAGAQSAIGSVAGIGVAAAGAIGALSLAAGQVVKLREAFTTVSSSGVRSLSTLGRAAGVLGGAIAVLGVVDLLKQFEPLGPGVDRVTASLKQWQDQSRAAGVIADAFGNDLSDLGDQISLALGDRLIAGSALVSTLFDQFSNRGRTEVLRAQKTFEDFDQALTDLVKSGSAEVAITAFKQIAAAAKEQGVSVDDLAKMFPGYTQVLSDATTGTLQYAGVSKEAQQALAGQAQTVGAGASVWQRLGGVLHESIKIEGDASDAIKKHEAALSSLIGELDRYQARLKGNRDSSRQAALAQLDAADAVQGVADAQGAYNDAVAQYGPNSAEAAAAQRELQRAIIGAYQAQDDATQAVIDNAAAQAGYQRGTKNSAAETSKYVAELVKARNETSGPTRDAINQHIAKILGIPVERATKMTLPEIRRRLRELKEHKDGIDRVPKDKKTKVTAEGTETAKGKVKGVKDEIDGLKDKNVTVTVSTVVQLANQAARALAEFLGFEKGGRIPANRVSVVGEAGPELLVDGASKRTRVIGADGPELIRPATAGFVIPNDKIHLEDGRRLRAGMLDNGLVNATFVHNGPVDASTTATLYGDDKVIMDKGRQSRGLLKGLAGRRASGGPVEGGLPYLVGESGPELVVPGSDSNVMSNQRLRQLYRLPNVPDRQSGDVIVVNFHGPVASQRQAEDWVVSALASARRRGNRLAS